MNASNFVVSRTLFSWFCEHSLVVSKSISRGFANTHQPKAQAQQRFSGIPKSVNVETSLKLFPLNGLRPVHGLNRESVLRRRRRGQFLGFAGCLLVNWSEERRAYTLPSATSAFQCIFQTASSA